MGSIGFQNLPEFIQIDIFHQLKLGDLSSCSLVCRKWHSMVWSKTTEMDLSNRKKVLISKSYVSDRGLIRLSSLCPLIRVLILDGNFDITDEGLLCISAIQHITTLSVKYCKGLTDKSVVGFSRMKKLKSLDISGLNRFTGKGIREIFKLIQLKCLYMKNLPFLEDRHLKDIVQLTNLQKLKIGGSSELTHKVFETIGKLIDLKELDISRNSRFGHHSGFSHLTNLQKLEVLRMKSIVVTKKARESFSLFINHIASLEELNLGFINANEKLCGSISKGVNMSKLTMNGVKRLKSKSFKCFKKLTYFDFSRSTIPPGALKYLTNVRTLILDQCKFENELIMREGAVNQSAIENRALSCIKKMKNLKNLSICSPSIRDVDIVAITRCKKLESLDLLWYSSRSERCLRYLSNLRMLTYLNLANCKFLTDKSLEFILPNLRNLESLSLSRCLFVTDLSLKFLSSHCLRLKNLNLFHLNEISTVGVFQLHKLKELEILEISACKSVNFNICNSYLRSKIPQLIINGDRSASTSDHICSIS